MTKYIKQEVPDMQKTGEQKVFYRLKVERNIDFQEFIQKLCTYHSGISHGEALRVLISTSEVLAELLGEGYSVTLENWGTFKATLGLEDGKEMDTIDGNESKRNARSLCLNGVNFWLTKNWFECKTPLQAGACRNSTHKALAIHQRGTPTESTRLSGREQGTESQSIHGTYRTGPYDCRMRTSGIQP